MPGRGGRGGRGGGARPREEQISRALSKLLRHQAEKEGLKLGPGGYVNLQEVVRASQFNPHLLSYPLLTEITAQ
jgi:2'-phosphotransferase